MNLLLIRCIIVCGCWFVGSIEELCIFYLFLSEDIVGVEVSLLFLISSVLDENDSLR